MSVKSPTLERALFGTSMASVNMCFPMINPTKANAPTTELIAGARNSWLLAYASKPIINRDDDVQLG